MCRPEGVIWQILPDPQCPLVGEAVPESQVDQLLVDLHGNDAILEDGGNVVDGKTVFLVPESAEEYEHSMQVFPTAPSPTITSLTATASIKVYRDLLYTHPQEHIHKPDVPFSSQIPC